MARAGILTLAGMAVLVLVHQAISQDKFWFLPAITTWLSLTAWCLYLAYLLRVPGAILIAIIMGGVFGQWRRSWGLVALWLLGMTSLAILIIWPTFVRYFMGM